MGEGFTGASFNEPQAVINQERENVSPVVGSGSGSPSSDILPSCTPFGPEPLFSGCEERPNSDSLDGLIPRKRSKMDAEFSVDFDLNEAPPMTNPSLATLFIPNNQRRSWKQQVPPFSKRLLSGSRIARSVRWGISWCFYG
ncbi:hypothetical protein Hanom_Chr14g01260751 [Helianthus anomalus]